jgi:glycosyltransferase involved in cell wall biosynthesis
VRLNCRGSLPEAVSYGASLALWQRRLVQEADAVIVPSRFARERLRELGAPLDWERVHVIAPPLPTLAASAWQEPALAGSYALVVARLSPEKGIDVAIDACRAAGMPLVIAGDGPQRSSLERHAGDASVRFVGHVEERELDELRAGAALALAPSRSAETFGLAAAEAMAVGLPVLASRVGALPELVEPDLLVAPGDVRGLAEAIARFAGDRGAGARARERVRALCAPEVVAPVLAEVYEGT